MAKVKRLGTGITLMINAAKVGFVKSLTPPPKTRAKVDVTDTESLFMDYLDGDIPDLGTVKITCGWDPADTGDAAIDTIFDDVDSADRQKTFVIIYPKHLKQDTFTARILSITPAATKHDGEVTRDIEAVVTSAIARTTYTPS